MFFKYMYIHTHIYTYSPTTLHSSILHVVTLQLKSQIKVTNSMPHVQEHMAVPIQLVCKAKNSPEQDSLAVRNVHPLWTISVKDTEEGPHSQVLHGSVGCRGAQVQVGLQCLFCSRRVEDSVCAGPPTAGEEVCDAQSLQGTVCAAMGACTAQSLHVCVCADGNCIVLRSATEG